MPTITPSLWFDNNLEEAAAFYTAIFPNSSIEQLHRFTEAGPGTSGDIAWGTFLLDGQRFIGINGGPQFPFSEAVSFEIRCKDQAEVDYYWERLLDGGEEVTVRLAHGSIRSELADRARSALRAARRSGQRRRRDPGFAQHAQGRHRRIGGRRQRQVDAI